MKFSPSTGCFYPDDVVYPTYPDDLVEVQDSEFRAAMNCAPNQYAQFVDGKIQIFDNATPSIDQIKKSQIAFLKSSYKTLCNAPVNFTTEAGFESSFLIDNDSLQNISTVIDAGESAWKHNIWIDSNGFVVSPFSFEDLQNLKAAILAVKHPTYGDLLDKIALVQSASTVESIQAINFN